MIKCTTADIQFTYNNTNRLAGWVQPNWSDALNCSMAFTYKPTSATPVIIWSYEGGGGEYVRIGHNGTNWYLSYSSGGAPTVHLGGAIVLDESTFICFTKAGTTYKVNRSASTSNPALPLTEDINQIISLAFTFTQFTLNVNQDDAICNFHWKNNATWPSFDLADARNSWGAIINSNWGCPLRHPGDLDNHQSAVYDPEDYLDTRVWSTEPDWTTLVWDTDPEYLATQVCSAWLYNADGIVNEYVVSRGDIPASSVAYGTDEECFTVEDRGALPIGATISDYGYHAHLRSVADGVIAPNIMYGMYTENAALQTVRNGSNSVTATSSAALILAAGMTVDNIYDVTFGIEFEWTNISGSPVSARSGRLINPILIVYYIGEFGADTGTIIVEKVTIPEDDSTEFDFTAGGGLSPTSFSLSGGETRSFTGVAAGSGYSITETPNAGYITTYEVSNDSPIDNITVEADEVVTVTVTNIARIVGGIYKIVPGKRNDTLWNEDGSTIDVKIPRPFGRSGMIGD